MRQQQSKPCAVCLMGPTAAGKTELALALASELPFTIVSVDSAMVYKGMDIGTAKPSKAIQAQFPHYLLDICDSIEVYSAARFRHDALQAIQAIQANGRIPLLVGGTMLYFKALQQGLAELPSADETLRKEINQQAAQHGWLYLHQRLQKVDPQAAATIHPNDAQRIQRALEVYYLTEKPLTLWQQQQREQASNIEFINMAIVPHDRLLLHQRIEQRFYHMLEIGFMKEVKRLWQRSDLHAGLPAIRAVGYRQVWDFFAGKYDYSAMPAKAIAATRQLAKRQITWLRHWQQPVRYFAVEDKENLEKIVNYLRTWRY